MEPLLVEPLVPLLVEPLVPLLDEAFMPLLVEPTLAPPSPHEGSPPSPPAPWEGSLSHPGAIAIANEMPTIDKKYFAYCI